MSAASDRDETAFDTRKAGTETTDRDGRQPSAPEISAEEQARRRAATEAMLRECDDGTRKKVTREEILAWRHEGHKY